MRILVIEDDEGVARFIKQGLAEEGYAVDLAYDGEEGLMYARSAPFDVAIVDIMLPELNGIELVRRLRAEGRRIPIMLLTARDGTADKIEGLDSGADDYLAKPFAFPELLARIRALARRPPSRTSATLRYADIEMDLARHEVRRAGRPVELSPREFALLEALMAHPEQTLSRSQIIRKVWSSDFLGQTNVIDVYIGYLRRKLEHGSRSKIIRTVRGIGYCLMQPHE